MRRKHFVRNAFLVDQLHEVPRPCLGGLPDSRESGREEGQGTHKGTAVQQSVCNEATITNWPLLSLFSPDTGKAKNPKILTFQKNNGQEDWESLIRPGLSKIWSWETIFEVCTVTVLMCSSQLSLIKLPLGNLMKLETTLKACWSTDCWSASDRKYFRSMFWPVAIVFVTLVNICEHRLWSGCAERTKRAF